eukprot:TRINITY_DN2600_c1_g1_i1.p1 TRINITY_DN2600_c1_g1~~TRINITY_DN2600_c1_g1_i1.p1  ORF type:complete len:443 (+),score=152.78 TRINITY_DN2600_c1_g1_i1:114-1331(+)
MAALQREVSTKNSQVEKLVARRDQLLQNVERERGEKEDLRIMLSEARQELEVLKLSHVNDIQKLKQQLEEERSCPRGDENQEEATPTSSPRSASISSSSSSSSSNSFSLENENRLLRKRLAETKQKMQLLDEAKKKADARVLETYGVMDSKVMELEKRMRVLEGEKHQLEDEHIKLQREVDRLKEGLKMAKQNSDYLEGACHDLEASLEAAEALAEKLGAECEQLQSRLSVPIDERLLLIMEEEKRVLVCNERHHPPSPFEPSLLESWSPSGRSSPARSVHTPSDAGREESRALEMLQAKAGRWWTTSRDGAVEEEGVENEPVDFIVAAALTRELLSLRMEMKKMKTEREHLLDALRSQSHFPGGSSTSASSHSHTAASASPLTWVLPPCLLQRPDEELPYFDSP